MSRDSKCAEIKSYPIYNWRENLDSWPGSFSSRRELKSRLGRSDVIPKKAKTAAYIYQNIFTRVTDLRR